ncbi:glycoside hydrolase family 3 C-terminal domain-containing protein [Paenibacillaceae bacterium WGS1546]|uniref:glycoside hydrolase family 3 C-terminal domain-containing protein n=1 Tax=Cohnella sp. WGS1546 TaxID=3366810 RepID=UPI00372D4F88
MIKFTDDERANLANGGTYVTESALLFLNPDLPLDKRVADLASRLTLEEKIDLMCQYQEEIPRLGIRKYKHGTEAAHGIAWLGEATVFPQPFGLACTWDEELLREVGEAIGTEARGFFARDPALNGLTLWAPTVDLLRDPRWGRTDEGYGEDPVHAGKMAAALVRGIQGDHPFYVRAVASPKHFIGNNNEIGRGDRSVSIDPRNMREHYLKAFEIPFREGGALSMMTSYNAVNGVPANLNPDINGIVKGEWGMAGFVVSDAGDVLGTVNDHRYSPDYKHAVAASIRSGIDSITDDHDVVKQAIRDALKEGLMDEADLDAALRNAFRVRMRLGEFDPPERNPYASIGEAAILAPEHRAVSLKAARANVVLLKNEGAALPLAAETIGRIAVVGPLADVVYRDWYSGTLPYAVTPLQGIRSRMDGRGEVAYAEGIDRVRLSANGQFVRVREDGKLAADGSRTEEAETFAVTDWGWRAHTFVAASTGRYLTTDDESVTADAQEIFGWFTKETFLVDRSSDGPRWRIRAWNEASIGIAGDGRLAVDAAGAEARSTLGSPETNAADKPAQADGEAIRSAEFDVSVVANGLREAAEAARGAGAAVVFVGNHPLVNGKETIDRPGLELPEAQQALVREVASVNPNTIVVIVGSYPFALGDAADRAKAVLYTSHAGPELGNAIADVLFGDYAPAGRLNMTWHGAGDRLPDFMDYDLIRGGRTYRYFEGQPEFPFGHGLTYVPFSYFGFRLDSYVLQEGGAVEATVEVRNDGDMDSDEVVQLYGFARSSRVKRPRRQLLAFRRVRVPAGATVAVSFRLKAEELAFWDVTRDQWCVEKAAWTLAVGRSSADLRAETKLDVRGETVPPRELTRPTRAVNYDDYANAYLDEGEEGGSCVAAKPGAWLKFADAEFPRGASRLEARVAGNAVGRVELRLGGPDGKAVGGIRFDRSSGTADVEGRKDVAVGSEPIPYRRQMWRTVSFAVDVPAGRHDIVLSLDEGAAISWFRLE